MFTLPPQLQQGMLNCEGYSGWQAVNLNQYFKGNDDVQGPLIYTTAYWCKQQNNGKDAINSKQLYQ